MSKKKSKKIPIDVSADKHSIKTRIDRANVIAAIAPQSPIYQADPQIKGATASVITARDALAAADAGVRNALLALAAARGLRDTKVGEFDAAYDVYTASAQKEAATPEDAAGLGLVVADKATYPLAPPIGVDAKFDVVTSQILIHVDRAPGLRICLVEISADPIGTGTWKQVPGVGARKALGGYAPGIYWVHAASVRAEDRSEFTAPVAVIVK